MSETKTAEKTVNKPAAVPKKRPAARRPAAAAVAEAIKPKGIDWAALKAPLREDEIEWRVSRRKPYKAYGTVMWVVPYLTNRAAQQRFDDACGPHNWSVEFVEYRNSQFLCKIGVRENGEWTFKEDGAEGTNIEEFKGGLSSAMKRCSVQWGVARDLYKYPAVFVQSATEEIPQWAYDKLHKLTAFINEGAKAIPQIVPVTPPKPKAKAAATKAA